MKIKIKLVVPNKNDSEDFIEVLNGQTVYCSDEPELEQILLQAIQSSDLDNSIFHSEVLPYLLLTLFREGKITPKQFYSWAEYAQIWTESDIKKILPIFDKNKSLTKETLEILLPSIRVTLGAPFVDSKELPPSKEKIEEMLNEFIEQLKNLDEDVLDFFWYGFEHGSKISNFFNSVTCAVQTFSTLDKVAPSQISLPTIVIIADKNTKEGTEVDVYFVKNKAFLMEGDFKLTAKINFFIPKSGWTPSTISGLLKTLSSHNPRVNTDLFTHENLEQIVVNITDKTQYIQLSSTILDILDQIKLGNKTLLPLRLYLGALTQESIYNGLEKKERRGTLWYPGVKYPDEIHNTKKITKKSVTDHDRIHRRTATQIWMLSENLFDFIIGFVGELRSLCEKSGLKEIAKGEIWPLAFWELVDMFYSDEVAQQMKKKYITTDIVISLLNKYSNTDSIVFFAFGLLMLKNKEKWEKYGINSISLPMWYLSNPSSYQFEMLNDIYEEIKNDPFPIQYLKYQLYRYKSEDWSSTCKHLDEYPGKVSISNDLIVFYGKEPSLNIRTSKSNIWKISNLIQEDILNTQKILLQNASNQDMIAIDKNEKIVPIGHHPFALNNNFQSHHNKNDDENLNEREPLLKKNDNDKKKNGFCCFC